MPANTEPREPGLLSRVIAAVVVASLVFAVAKFIDYRMRPPEPPASASSASAR